MKGSGVYMRRTVVALFLLVICTLTHSVQEHPSQLPALSRQWHGQDYQAASQAIAKGAIALPLFSESDGEKTLNRITSVDNLTYQSDTVAPLPARVQDNMIMMAAVSDIAKQYYLAANKGQQVHRELAAMLAFLVRTSASGASLLEQSISAMPRDYTYTKRMEGVKKIQSGLTNILLGAETSLSERNFYNANDISVILEALANSIAPIKRFLAPDVRDELLRKFLARQKELKAERDADNLSRIINELRT